MPCSTALPCSGCTEVDDINKPPFNLGALSISFSGCGFLGIYHMGVVAALRQYIPDLRVIKVAGCSAGALAAVCLLLDTPMGNFKLLFCCFSSFEGLPINPDPRRGHKCVTASIRSSTFLMYNKKHNSFGPWWWSSGQRARLLLRRSEFESR